MVRVGGGWCALDEFLVKNDPCRGEYPVPALHQAPQLQILRDPSVSIIIMTILLHTSKLSKMSHYTLQSRYKTNRYLYLLCGFESSEFRVFPICRKPIADVCLLTNANNIHDNSSYLDITDIFDNILSQPVGCTTTQTYRVVSHSLGLTL